MRSPALPLFLLSLISWSIFAYIIIFVDPENKGPGVIVIFFLIFFLALSSFSSVVIYAISSYLAGHFANKQIIFQESLRRGILIGLTIVGRGVLNLIWAYNFLNYLLFILILILVEIYFSKYSRV